jgi:hypothetical protein
VSSEEINGTWQSVTMLYECSGDQFGTMTLAQAIDWLQLIAAEQPCPPEEVVFKVRQSGDQWDGYSLAEIMIYRAETPEEMAKREAEWAEISRKRDAASFAEQRATYERLKAKFAPNG